MRSGDLIKWEKMACVEETRVWAFLLHIDLWSPQGYFAGSGVESGLRFIGAFGLTLLANHPISDHATFQLFVLLHMSPGAGPCVSIVPVRLESI